MALTRIIVWKDMLPLSRLNDPIVLPMREKGQLYISLSGGTQGKFARLTRHKIGPVILCYDFWWFGIDNATKFIERCIGKVSFDNLEP